MKEILIFAGTTEGRMLSENLAEAGVRHTVCVATEYGEIVLKPHPLVKVHRGRMNREEIREFLENGSFAAVVDATHPFAENVTCNIKAAAESGKLAACFRLKRDGTGNPNDSTGKQAGNITYCRTQEECAAALEHTEGNILLTAGSRELAKYCVSEEVKRRLYVRVLPVAESLSLCMEQGICGKQVIAMQGPFTVEMNEAIIRQYNISHLVTKESGRAGGYQEKLEAAKRTGTGVFVIGRPEEEGYSFSEICSLLGEICGKKIFGTGQIEITLAGIGMGSESCLTKEVREAVREADILLGAKRLLENISSGQETHAFYQAAQLIPYFREVQEKNQWMEKKKAVVLFSGDSGFYSGCRSVYTALEKEIGEGRLRASLRILPGISSVSYLASRIGESYQDAAVYSMHGKELCSLARRIKYSPKTFLLTSGVKDVNQLGELLTEADMEACEIVAGFRLSYGEQRIGRYTPSQCRGLKEEGLYTCLVRNPDAERRKLTHGMPDEEFIRDRVPMTKEEVREVSICKLRLHEGAVVYDIGSGTGSVSAEIAALSDDIQVYALERNREAAALTEKNIEKFGLQNITVVEAAAPEGMEGLPAATHAFIGGSGGRMREIITVLRQINSGMRVVIPAVSIETLCEIREILSENKVKGEEIVQLQVSRAKQAGNYHLMQAGNPVWICSFDLDGEYRSAEGTE